MCFSIPMFDMYIYLSIYLYMHIYLFKVNAIQRPFATAAFKAQIMAGFLVFFSKGSMFWWFNGGLMVV